MSVGRRSKCRCDHRLARLAARQFGLFTRAQALRIGYSSDGVARRVRRGPWVPVHRGVYRLPGAPESIDQRYLAATLYGGPHALLSGEAAGYKWGLGGCRECKPQIVTPRRLRDSTIVSKCRPEPLPELDHGFVDAIPVTSATRTLIDLAAAFSTGRLQYAVDSAITKRLTTPDRIALRLDELHRRGRPGAGRLQRLVQDALCKPAPHSGLERTFLRLLHVSGFREPTRQFAVDIGWERPIHIDFAYPDLLIGIETDGYEPHAARAQWELDRRRDAALALLGWLILRFTRDDVYRRDDYVVATLTEALRVRAAMVSRDSPAF